jgi:hypothetical protein
MPQIELKDLNCSLSAQSFLEDLTDEAVHIVGGTVEGTVDLPLMGSNITIAGTEEYRTFIETALSNLRAAEKNGTNYNVVYKTNSSSPVQGYLAVQTFSTGNV